MPEQLFDVVIVGAGPSGSSAAITLAKSGLKVALIDKASFPRDKTCGDALSVDVINQLLVLSGELQASFLRLKNKIPSYGVRIFSPNHNCIDIPFIYKGEKSHGYVSPRKDFDYLLFEAAKQYANVEIFEDCFVNSVEVGSRGAVVATSKGEFKCEMVIGADGANSIVSKCVGDIKVDRAHYSAGLRVYYENVTSFQEDNYIELHFFQAVLPGYLWIFPLAGNRANVGIGMPSSKVSANKVNLKEVLTSLLTTHPSLRERFKNATALETIKGYGLPLGSKKRNISGERFLLAGDAAALIDPFSGEGIANAIRSGRVAAEHTIKCFSEKNFSGAFNKGYDKEIYRRMWKEFKISRLLQQVVCYPRLFNFFVKQAQKSKYLQHLLTDALANSGKRQNILFRPGFYYRMFIR